MGGLKLFLCQRHRAGEIHAVQPCAGEVGPFQPGIGEVGPVQQSSGQIRPVETGGAQVHPDQPGPREVRLNQPGAGEVHAVKSRTGEIRTVQPGTGQVRAGQIGTQDPVPRREPTQYVDRSLDVGLRSVGRALAPPVAGPTEARVLADERRQHLDHGGLLLGKTPREPLESIDPAETHVRRVRAQLVDRSGVTLDQLSGQLPLSHLSISLGHPGGGPADLGKAHHQTDKYDQCGTRDDDPGASGRDRRCPTVGRRRVEDRRLHPQHRQADQHNQPHHRRPQPPPSVTAPMHN